MPCKDKKYAPNITLIITQIVLSPANNSWWANVAVNPLINRITVFNKGTWKGGITNRPMLGHPHLAPVRGDTLIWKNLQKTLKKNQTSLKRNHTSPHFKEPWTSQVWAPWNVLSRLISRNQVKKTNRVIIKNEILVKLLQPNLNQVKTPVIVRNLQTLIPNGSQLLSTKWTNCHDYSFSVISKR